MVRTRSGCGAGAVAAAGKGEAGDTSGGFEGGRGKIWVAAGAIRMLLIVYAVWHDSNFAVKYTDVDYMVFSDASRFAVNGGSPYDRDTYRYSPVLAWLLAPNVWIHPAWGKLLFAGADLFVGHQLLSMLENGPSPLPPAKATLYACAWLFNPVIVNVSTRGNAEAVVSALVVGSLSYLELGRLGRAGMLLGAAIHLKLYPIIYSLPLFLSIPLGVGKAKSPFHEFADLRRWYFAASAVVSCGILTGACWAACGWKFVEEAYLYHISRTDHRHNLSLYFYPLYLGGEAPAAKALSLAAFLPQIVLLLVLSARLASINVALCITCQTIAFVALNKVSTVQYFVWYMALLPIVVARGKTWSPKLIAACVTSMVVSLGSWLAIAYHVEFKGMPLWIPLQVASAMLFGAHVLLIVALVGQS